MGVFLPGSVIVALSFDVWSYLRRSEDPDVDPPHFAALIKTDHRDYMII
jgi:hypothetical protein